MKTLTEQNQKEKPNHVLGEEVICIIYTHPQQLNNTPKRILKLLYNKNITSIFYSSITLKSVTSQLKVTHIRPLLVLDLYQ